MGAETWKSLRYLAKTEGIRVEGFRFRMDIFGFDVLRVRSFFLSCCVAGGGFQVMYLQAGVLYLLYDHGLLSIIQIVGLYETFRNKWHF